MVWTVSDTLFLWWNRTGGLHVVENCGQLDLDTADLVSMGAFLDIISEEDRPIYETFLEKLEAEMALAGETPLAGLDTPRVALRMRVKGGDYRYHMMECYLGRDGDAGILVSVAVVVREMTADEIYRMDLAKAITIDQNPTIFTRNAQAVMDANPDKKYAFVQFDVAKFKAINELYGESFGDELLNFFVDSLRIICGKDRPYIRLSGDVFMILTDYETKQDILDLIEDINFRLLDYKDVPYRLVFGVSYIDDISQGLRKLGDEAAVARQSIKDSALERIAFYDEKMKAPILLNKYMEDRMEQALQDREFVVYLQPKCSIDDGTVVGAEALVRWFDKERGMMPPMEFIPLFEKNGFITRLDAFVWEEVCRVIRGWLDSGKRCVPVSVNMSRVHLKGDRFIPILDSLLKKYDIPQRYLEIEVTESADEGNVHDQIVRLKEKGYTLLMDDFGSGYSTLNILKDTQFDTIKIDRMFFRDLMESLRGKEIIKYVIAMAKAIGLDVMAEGVETKEQADFLLTCGCHAAQGFYYAKPMPVSDFNKLL